MSAHTQRLQNMECGTEIPFHAGNIEMEADSDSDGEANSGHPVKEDLQGVTEETPVTQAFFASDKHGSVNPILYMNFPRKLWQIVESEYFKSICWDDCGTCVVLNEELFNTEVLGRKKTLKIFKMDSTKSFIRQLNLYGFRKVQRELERSASLANFLAEETSAAEFSKLQFFQSPYFRRNEPHLLVRMKRRIGIRNGPLAISEHDPDMIYTNPQRERRKKKEKCSLGEHSGSRFYTDSLSWLQRPFLPIKQAVGDSTTLLTSSVTSLRNEMDEDVEFNSREHACSNSENVDRSDSAICMSSKTVLPPSYSAMRFPGFPPAYPDMAAQANLESLMPFFCPWLSMHMIAPASPHFFTRSLRNRDPPSSNHCLNCNCFAGALHNHVQNK